MNPFKAVKGDCLQRLNYPQFRPAQPIDVRESKSSALAPKIRGQSLLTESR